MIASLVNLTCVYNKTLIPKVRNYSLLELKIYNIDKKT